MSLDSHANAADLVENGIRYTHNLNAVDWATLVDALEADNFHNGRTVEQMERSYRNSSFCVLAYDGHACVGNVRVLSDGVCNSYIVDVWTRSSHRRRGIGRRMMEIAMARLPGQHIYLFTDSALEFYQTLGFTREPEGMGRVEGYWLQTGPPYTPSEPPEA
ncbi:MAG: GNAT family N-acetyltransferase [Caldilineaceae bacterium]